MRDYLVHYGYADTLAAFDSAAGVIPGARNDDMGQTSCVDSPDPLRDLTLLEQTTGCTLRLFIPNRLSSSCSQFHICVSCRPVPSLSRCAGGKGDPLMAAMPASVDLATVPSHVLMMRGFERRADAQSGSTDMALRHDVRQRIVAGDVEAAQKLLQQRRPQLLAIPPTPRTRSEYGAGHESTPALVADPADGVPMEEDDPGRDEELEDGEMGRGSGAFPL